MDIAQMIGDVARDMGVDPRLALELAIRESNLNQNARGSSGEIGIFQLMPTTAIELGVNPFDVRQNIRGGITYLRQQLVRFGDAARALAAYNCGPGCVAAAVAQHGANWLAGVPASTRSYVSAILGKVQTAWTANTPSTPAAVIDAVRNMPQETWRRWAIVAGIGLAIWLGAGLLQEAVE